MEKIDVSIVGASGYVGGELLRLLLQHPNVNLKQATSETYNGQFIKTVHPNLRQFPIKFSSVEELKNCDVLFLCLPHGTGMEKIEEFFKKGKTVIDLSADFRLNDPKLYEIWYGLNHSKVELLKKKALGLPEIYKTIIKKSKFISCPGCMSTTAILGLYPLVKAGVLEKDQPIIIEAKTGSTGAGNKLTKAGLHAQRSGAMRSFKATGHRHSAEITQELTIEGVVPQVHFSATAVEAVRGILTTSHVFLKPEVTEADVWGIYREFVKDKQSSSSKKPFLRIVKEQKGNFRYPEPKILIGTNVCEIGFEKDPHSNRLVVMAALDNLMKGAAGQAVQCLNINQGWEEETGLSTVGLFPI